MLKSIVEGEEILIDGICPKPIVNHVANGIVTTYSVNIPLLSLTKTIFRVLFKDFQTKSLVGNYERKLNRS